MKKKLPSIFIGLLFLIGLGIMTYPIISNQWNTYRQNKLIENYKLAVKDLSKDDFQKEWQEAKAFNETIVENNIFSDVFGQKNKESEKSAYNLSIPEINFKLAIYHGTSDDVLQTGIGHMNGSKLPIGGESTHCVLAAHRGLPSAELFTNIDQLQTGDKFYIHVLDQVLAYKVDQILPMVDKDDQKTLKEALSIHEGQDEVSLFTCTPYGVNSHRLIVRGHRVAYNGEENHQTVGDKMLESIKNYYMFILILGLALTFLMILIMRYLFNKRKGGSKDEKEIL
mgnify:CR=1 FL=1